MPSSLTNGYHTICIQHRPRTSSRISAVMLSMTKAINWGLKRTLGAISLPLGTQTTARTDCMLVTAPSYMSCIISLLSFEMPFFFNVCHVHCLNTLYAFSKFRKIKYNFFLFTLNFFIGCLKRKISSAGGPYCGWYNLNFSMSPGCIKCSIFIYKRLSRPWSGEFNS